MIEGSVVVAVIVTYGAVKLVETLRVRSRAETFDGAPRTQLEASSLDGTHVRLSLDPPTRSTHPTRRP